MMIAIFIVSVVLIVIALIALSNSLMFPRLRRAGIADDMPLVSVLIPARDEADVIGRTVRLLLEQRYTHLEVIVLDDHSEDGTGDYALQAARGDSRLRVIEGEALPQGWLGKNWACHQLAQAATGELFIFADADVGWSKDGIASLMHMMTKTRADLLTVWPTQITETWGERLTVPLMALAIMAYLPVAAVHYTSFSWFAAACGQCLVFRRQVYEALGGHMAVRDNIIEDVALARLTKAKGLRLRMTDGAGLIGCRMYADWDAARRGFAKNILAGHGNRMLLLLLSTVFHWGVFIFPWIWLAIDSGNRGWSLALVMLGVVVRALSAAATGQRMRDAVLLPVSVILMTVIALQAVWWHWHGGPQWKGRVITKINSASNSKSSTLPQPAYRKYPVSSHKVRIERS